MKKVLLTSVALFAAVAGFAQKTSFSSVYANTCLLQNAGLTSSGMSFTGHGLTNGGQDKTNGYVIINSNKAAQQAQGTNAAPCFMDPYITVGSGETAQCVTLQSNEDSVPSIATHKIAKIRIKADSDVKVRLILGASAGGFPASTNDQYFAGAEFKVGTTDAEYTVDFSGSTTTFDFSYVDCYGLLVNPGEKDADTTGYQGKLYVSAVSWGADAVGVFDPVYKASAVNVYPNPAEGAVNVEGVSSSAVLSLKNSNGIAVKSGNGSTLSLDGLNSGLYFLEVNDNGALKTAKVMVK